jgi:hypothetical protein
MSQVVDVLGSALAVLMAAGVTLWMAGAIYCDVCRCGKWGRLAAAGWVIGVVVAFALWQPLWHPLAVLIGVWALFLVWWLRLKPSHNREWEPADAVLPRAVRDGDAVTIENVRNFEYQSLEKVTPRYETRTFHLSSLSAVDMIVFNWGSAVMSHPVLVFDFGPEGRVCMSIEVRYRKGRPTRSWPASIVNTS